LAWARQREVRAWAETACEVRPVDMNVYVAGVAWLRDLFEASVRTGRPVIWS
jgi:hypothetical protein